MSVADDDLDSALFGADGDDEAGHDPDDPGAPLSVSPSSSECNVGESSTEDEDEDDLTPDSGDDDDNDCGEGEIGSEDARHLETRTQGGNSIDFGQVFKPPPIPQFCATGWVNFLFPFPFQIAFRISGRFWGRLLGHKIPLNCHPVG